MSVTIQVPDDLYEKARKIAEREHVSVDEVFASFFCQQLDVLEYIRRRGARGSREKFLAVLDKASHLDPPEYDRL